MPNNNDIVGSIRGRGMLAEGIAAGRLGPVALCFAWLTVGLPCLLCMVGSGYLIVTHVLFSAGARILPSLMAWIAGNLIPGFGLYLVARGTAASIKRRRGGPARA